MTRFTFDNHRLTIENIGDADRAVVEIEIDSQDGDECYASVAIPDTEVPRIASALLEAAGYGETDTPEVLRSQNPGKLFIRAARRRAKLDEMTREGAEDGTADDVDEYVNTRPGRRVAARAERISVADRVVRRSDKHNDQPGIVTRPIQTRMGDPAWMVLWDDDPEEEDGPYMDWELRKVLNGDD